MKEIWSEPLHTSVVWYKRYGTLYLNFTHLFFLLSSFHYVLFTLLRTPVDTISSHKTPPSKFPCNSSSWLLCEMKWRWLSRSRRSSDPGRRQLHSVTVTCSGFLCIALEKSPQLPFSHVDSGTEEHWLNSAFVHLIVVDKGVGNWN